MKKFIIISFFLIGNIASAQNWIQSSGIANKIVRTLIPYNGDTLLAGVDNEGIFISYDNGINWNQFALNGQTVYSIIKVDTSIIAGTYGNDIYKSSINNIFWQNIPIANLVISKLAINNDTLFASAYPGPGGGIYYSINNGNTWASFPSIPTNASLDIDFNSHGRIFAATPVGSYYSTNQSPWVQTTGFGITTRTVKYIGNDSLIYGTDSGIFLSTNNGGSAQKLIGITQGSVFYINDTIYIAPVFGGNGLFYLPNITSNELSLNLNKQIYSLINSKGKLIAGTDYGVYILSDFPTNIIEKSFSDELRVFPNPVSNKLFLENFNDENFNVEIYSLEGQLILKEISNNSINTSKIKPGIYFYKIYSENKSAFGKIIKD